MEELLLEQQPRMMKWISRHSIHPRALPDLGPWQRKGVPAPGNKGQDSGDLLAYMESQGRQLGCPMVRATHYIVPAAESKFVQAHLLFFYCLLFHLPHSIWEHRPEGIVCAGLDCGV